MEHINRRGDAYFAYQGTTKTGKPKYFASKKTSSPNATRIADLPGDFEFFENPINATVVMRRRKRSLLTCDERDMLSRLALEHSKLACAVIIDGNALVVYASPATEYNSAMEAIMPGIGNAIQQSSNLEPGFKFELAQVEKRKFTAERYCYRGSIDGWWPLHNRPDDLESVATKYLPHLGQDSFFELS